MSLSNLNGRTQPNNEKSINPYVSTKGNILVSKCCGVEMVYRVSETKYRIDFDMFDFCPQCLDCCETFEVKSSDYDRDIYLDENDNFNYEGYDSENYILVPKCESETYTNEQLNTTCFYCKEHEIHKELLSFDLVSFSTDKVIVEGKKEALNGLEIKVCEDCYFTYEEELKDNCNCDWCYTNKCKSYQQWQRLQYNKINGVD